MWSICYEQTRCVEKFRAEQPSWAAIMSFLSLELDIFYHAVLIDGYRF